MSGRQFTADSDGKKTTVLVLRITCICWLAAKLISWRLWLTNRTFPLLPATGFLVLPGWMHLALFIASLSLMVFVIVMPTNRFVLIGLLLAEVVSCLLDQNRLQPWQYQYLCMLLIFLLYYKNVRVVSSGFRFIIFSTYLFSGVSKLNAGFIESVWQKTILLRFFGLPSHIINNPAVLYAGYFVPAVEIVAAVLLFFKGTRKAVAVALILVNVFNLLLLGPLGINYNIIVWPWNIGMIGILYVLFARPGVNQYSLLPLLSLKTSWILIIWGLLPATNSLGFWDDYLSSALYSGRAKQLVICMSNKQQYPAGLVSFINDGSAVCPGSKYLVVNNWALQEMKVPCYPELRVFGVLEKELKKRYQGYNFTFKVYKGRDTLPH